MKPNSFYNGCFDLVKVPKLRAFCGEFLKSLREDRNLTQKLLANLLKIPKSTLANWENNRCMMPISLLTELQNKETIYKLIRKGVIKFPRTKLPLSFQDIKDVIGYITPMGRSQVYIKKCDKKTLEKIVNIFNIRPHFREYAYYANSLELHNFIKAFFEDKKKLKLSIPLTKIVKEWHKDGIDLRRALICPLIQTDGSCHEDTRKGWMVFSFKNTSKVLHKLLVDAVFFTYNFLPTTYLIPCTNKPNIYFTQYVGMGTFPIYKDLKVLCGNFKHSPAVGQKIERYLREDQPHLKYLLGAKLMEKIIALRIWASADGCVIPMRVRSGSIIGLILPAVKISCVHPILVKHLHEITENLGVHFSLKKGKTWSGYRSLWGTSVSTAISFLFIGGFIAGTKVTKNSKYYAGVDKQNLLLATLEFMVKQRENPYEFRSLSLKSIHTKIREMAEKGQFREPDFYIKYFRGINQKIKKRTNKTFEIMRGLRDA